jgi:hypothetical protein
MNMNMNVHNILLDNRYIISPELQDALEKGRLPSSPLSVASGDKLLNKNYKGIYLVMFRILKKDSNILVYNYIYYPYIFFSCLFTYLITKDKYINSVIYKEWGDYLTVIDYKFNDSNLEDKFMLNIYNEHFKNLINTMSNTKYIASNYLEMFNFLNRLLYIADNEIMSELIDLACKRHHLEFLQRILGSFMEYDLNKKKLDNDKKEDDVNINIINGCLFVVQDLNLFIEGIKNKNYIVNEGPQKWRGQVNSINNFLNCLDMDFRNSLYLHNLYHIQNRNIDKRFELSKSKFSFNNIHMNLGNVRWYSTKRSIKDERVSTKAIVPSKKSVEVNSTIIKHLECKSLVPWGDNLYSTVGIKLSQKELDMIKLSLFAKSVMIGLLLSDGYIVFSSRSKHGRFGLTQSLAHSSYIYSVFNILAHYCPRYPVFTIRSRFGKPFYSLEIFTRSMSCITELYNDYYINKTKIIKPCIYNDLTPIALAHWIMGDGTFNGISILLCTDSYSIKDIVILINVLIIKYDIHCTIRHHKNIYPRIYILKKDLFKLRLIVQPFMHKSMIYKLGL